MFVLVQVRELQDRLRWYQEQQQGGQPRHTPQSPSGQHDRDARNEDLMQMATAIGVSGGFPWMYGISGLAAPS